MSVTFLTSAGTAQGVPPPASYAVAARTLSVSERHLRRLVAEKKLRIIRIGRRVLVPADELARLAREGC